jgi:hypothetical protein
MVPAAMIGFLPEADMAEAARRPYYLVLNS